MIGQLCVILSLFLALTNAGIFPRAADPKQLFEDFFSQLPEIMRVGFPDKDLKPLDPWNPGNFWASVSINFNNTMFDFTFYDPKLFGLSQFNVTDFDLTIDNSTGVVYVDYMQSMSDFVFAGHFFCTYETEKFYGGLKIYGTSFVRNTTYEVKLQNDTYVWHGTTWWKTTTTDKNGFITFEPGTGTQQYAMDAIFDNFKELVEAVTDNIITDYEFDEVAIEKELLLRLQTNASSLIL